MTELQKFARMKVAALFKGINFSHNPTKTVDALFKTKNGMAGISNKIFGWAARSSHPEVIQGANKGQDIVHKTIMEGASNPRVGGLASPGSGVAFVKRKSETPFKSRGGRREVVAHEAFHARHPIIGAMETPAYAYGGFKRGKPGTSLVRRLKESAVAGRRGLKQDFPTFSRWMGKTKEE